MSATGRSAYADSPGPAAAGDPVPRHGDDVAEDGRGGRVATGAAAVEHQLAGGRGLDEDGVEGVADRRRAGGCAGSSPGGPGR